MGDSQLEDELSQKKEIVHWLRALVQTPGWRYIKQVLEQQGLTVQLKLKEAATLDDLLKVNSELREVATYNYLATLPETIIAEFLNEVEASDGD